MPRSKGKQIKAGTRFGERLVLGPASKSPNGHSRWKCQCACGGISIVFQTSIRRGVARSCSKCAVRKTHGLSSTDTYKAWENMKSRCTTNESSPYFSAYGARGITFCGRWQKFENFWVDMGHRPEGKSLDRKNNDLGYYKKNCRWATPIQNSNNGRHNVKIKHLGIVQTLAEWTRELGMTRKRTASMFGVPS